VTVPRQTRGWESIWANLDALPQYWRTPEPAVVAWARSLWEAGGRRVYDLGCGVGRHTLAFARMGFTVTAADVTPAGLAICAAELASEGLTVDLLCHEMEALPTLDCAFDGLIAYNVVYHATLAGMRRVLDDLHRVLRPDGRLYATVIARGDSRVAGYQADVEASKCVEIEPFTFIYLQDAPDDKHLPHHYCDEAEVRDLLVDFMVDDLRLVSVEYTDEDGVARTGVHYHVQAHRS
jgi:tellurite methyltransferase